MTDSGQPPVPSATSAWNASLKSDASIVTSWSGRTPRVRVALEDHFATARLPFHDDLNVGDPVVPGPATAELLRLLGGEPIRRWATPWS